MGSVIVCLVCLTKNREYFPCKNREKPSRDLLALNNKPNIQSAVGMVTRQDCLIRILRKVHIMSICVCMCMCILCLVWRSV